MSYTTQMDIIKNLINGKKIEKNRKDYLIDHINLTLEIKDMAEKKLISIKNSSPTQLGQDLYNAYVLEQGRISGLDGIMKIMAIQDIEKFEITKRPEYIIEQIRYQSLAIQQIEQNIENGNEPGHIKEMRSNLLKEKVDKLSSLLTNKDKEILTQMVIGKDSLFIVKDRDTKTLGSPWNNKKTSRSKPQNLEPTEKLNETVRFMDSYEIPMDNFLDNMFQDSSKVQSVKVMLQAGLIKINSHYSEETDNYETINTYGIELTPQGQGLAEKVISNNTERTNTHNKLNYYQ